MANGAGAAAPRRREREPERGERKEEEKLKTSQVGRVLGARAGKSLGDKLSSYLQRLQNRAGYTVSTT